MLSKINQHIGVLVLSIVFSLSIVYAHEGEDESQSATSATTTPSVQEITATEVEQTNLATTVEATAADLGVEQGFFASAKRRIAKVFTRSQAKKARLDLELAHLDLLAARQALVQNDTAKAQTLIDKYNERIAAVRSQLEAVGTTLPKDDPKVAELIAKVTETQPLAASELNRMALKAAGQFNKKLLKSQAQAFEDVAKVFNKQDLTAAEIQVKLAKIAEKFSKHESQASRKLAKKMALTEALKEAADGGDDRDIEDAAEGFEEAELKKVAKQKPEQIHEAAEEIQKHLKRSLVVLQGLLSEVPETARPAIQTAIDKRVEFLKKKVEKDDDALDQALGDDDGGKFAERKKEILEKLKAKDEKIKDRVEKHEAKIKEQKQKMEEKIKERQEKLEKAKEKVEEKKKKVLEKTQERKNASEEKAEEVKKEVKEGTSGSGSSETNELKTYKIKFREDGEVESDIPTNGAKKGDKIEFEFKKASTYNSNPHPSHPTSWLNFGAVTKDSKKTVTIPEAGSFGVHDHNISTISIPFTVQ